MPRSRLPHLTLTRISATLPRRKQRSNFRPPERNAPQHAKMLMDTVTQVQQEFQEQRRQQPFQFNPALIMRVQLAGAMDTANWRSLGLQVLGTEPDKATIVFASDTELQDFRQKVAAYAQTPPVGQKDHSYRWLGLIESMSCWGPTDRIGHKLSKVTIASEEMYTVDVELWYFDDKEACRQRQAELKQFVRAMGQEYLDQYLGNSLCLARVRVTGAVLTQLLHTDTVATVELPPQPELSITEVARLSIDDFTPVPQPPDNAPRICIIDSGLERGHPLLGPAVGDTTTVPASLGSSLDQAGHGTMVGGLALYGDFAASITSRSFTPELYLFSVRVTNNQGQFDDHTLLVNQMRTAIEQMHTTYGCRVFNISLGDPHTVLRDQDRPTFWATALDELVREKDIVIIVSAGNYPIEQSVDDPETLVRNYVQQLLTAAARIIDPAMAANVLTVGSLAHAEASYLGAEQHPNDPAYPAIAGIDEPSPFTRCGPGFENAIKPELCEYGGNMLWDGRLKRFTKDRGLGVISTNYRSVGSSLFRTDSGTSFAAPRVAHQAAQILGRYPGTSANLVRALLVASAQVPPAVTALVGFTSASQKEQVLQLCGYGKPNLEQALYSTERRVTLFTEEQIALDHFHLYTIPFPEAFKTLRGRRRVTVTLAFDPPVRRTRRDYIGCRMSFKLFKDIPLATIVEHYEKLQGSPASDTQRRTDAPPDIDLWPGVQARHAGTVQKGSWEMKRRPACDEETLLLAVWCENRWALESEEMQRYALVVSLEHLGDSEIDLYNLIQARIQQPALTRIRV
jgi:hypothetical protein